MTTDPLSTRATSSHARTAATRTMVLIALMCSVLALTPASADAAAPPAPPGQIVARSLTSTSNEPGVLRVEERGRLRIDVGEPSAQGPTRIDLVGVRVAPGATLGFYGPNGAADYRYCIPFSPVSDGPNTIQTVECTSVLGVAYSIDLDVVGFDTGHHTVGGLPIEIRAKDSAPVSLVAGEATVTKVAQGGTNAISKFSGSLSFSTMSGTSSTGTLKIYPPELNTTTVSGLSGCSGTTVINCSITSSLTEIVFEVTSEYQATKSSFTTQMTFVPDGGTTVTDGSTTATGVTAIVPDEGTGPAPNPAPVATDTNVVAYEDTPTPIPLGPLAEDESTADDDLTFAVLSPPAHGSVGVEAGQFVYTPEAEWSGHDEFSYSVTDRGAEDACPATTDSCRGPESSVGVVRLDVRPVLDPPTAVTLDWAAIEDSTSDPLTTRIAATAVTTDPLIAVDLSRMGIGAPSPAKGRLATRGSGGPLTYTPDPDFNGGDTWSLVMTDTNGHQVEVPVAQTVVPVNDLPTIDPPALATPEETPLFLDVRPWTDDVETETEHLTFAAVGASVGSLVDGSEPGTFEFRPPEDFVGDATVAISVTDRGDPDSPLDCPPAQAGCDGAETVTHDIPIVVTPIPDPPVVTLTAPESAPAGSTAEITFQVTDPDEDSSFTVSDASCGTGAALVPGSLAVDESGGSFDCTFSEYDLLTEVAVTVVDETGLDDTDNAPVRITWQLAGFHGLGEPGTVNVVKGGSTVPLRFDVFAGQREITDVEAVEDFTVRSLSCLWLPSGAEEPVEFTTPGKSQLRYDGEQFAQNWKTPKGADRCYVVTMTTIDGSSLSALFRTR